MELNRSYLSLCGGVTSVFSETILVKFVIHWNPKVGLIYVHVL